MKRNLGTFGAALGLACAAFCVATSDVQAGGAKRRHRFKSAPAPARGKTPALDANGVADSSAKSPVAGAAVQGGFRQDLFHRIYVFPVILPPLRERPEDIPALAAHFAAQIARQNGWKEVTFTDDAARALEAHNWPGNIRELRNVVERLLLFAEGDTVTATTVQAALPTAAGSEGSIAIATSGTLAHRVEQVERQMILDEIKRHNHHITNAAKALGLERSHLYKKCQQLGIDLREMRK